MPQLETQAKEHPNIMDIIAADPHILVILEEGQPGADAGDLVVYNESNSKRLWQE